MQREESASLATYLPKNLKIFSCVTLHDDQPGIIFLRNQDSCIPPQNYLFDWQQKGSNSLTSQMLLQQPHHESLYSTAVKRYFATITLSQDKIDSFKALLPVIDKLYYLQFNLSNKQGARSARKSQTTQLWIWANVQRKLYITKKSRFPAGKYGRRTNSSI